MDQTQEVVQGKNIPGIDLFANPDQKGINPNTYPVYASDKVDPYAITLQGDQSASAKNWGTSPVIDSSNLVNAEAHMIANKPNVDTIMKLARPDATPQDRLKAAEVFKQYSQSRPEDVIRSVMNLDPAGLYVALTGGSPRFEQAYDANGKQYHKYYNARISATNPAGEFLGVMDPVTGKILSPQEQEAIGPLTSRSDITAERQARFIAQGLSFRDVAASNSGNYINMMKSGAAAATNGTGITDLANEVNALGQKLGKYSLPPAVLEQLTGINSLRSGNTQAIKKAQEKIAQHLSGNTTDKQFKDDVNQSGGLNFGLQYKEGQGLFYGNQKIKTQEDLDRVVNNYMKEQQTSENVDRRRDDLLKQATIAATAIDPANRQQALVDISSFINKNAQIAQMQNQIEANGGVPGVKPNLPHALGESYQSGTLKAISDRAYGETANEWAQFLNQKRAQLPPGAVPPMGQWEAEFANSANVKAIKQRAKQDSLSYLQSAKAEMEKQSLANPPVNAPASVMNAAPPPLPEPSANAPAPAPAPAAAPVKSAPPPTNTKSSASSSSGIRGFVSALKTPAQVAAETNADPSIPNETKKSIINRYKAGYEDALRQEKQDFIRNQLRSKHVGE